MQKRTVSNLRNVDEDLAKRVADGLGIELPEKSKAVKEPVDLKPSDKLSIQKNMKKTLNGRTVAVVVANGTDKDEVEKLTHKIKHEHAMVKLIAPKVHGVKFSDGTEIKADARLDSSPSALFDAVAIVVTEHEAEKLSKQGAAVEFVIDAFGHLKAIGAVDSASKLLHKAGVEKDDGVTGIGSDFIDAAKQRFWDREHKVRELY